jgi:hypothetical protein
MPVGSPPTRSFGTGYQGASFPSDPAGRPARSVATPHSVLQPSYLPQPWATGCPWSSALTGSCGSSLAAGLLGPSGCIDRDRR